VPVNCTLNGVMHILHQLVVKEIPSVRCIWNGAVKVVPMLLVVGSTHHVHRRLWHTVDGRPIRPTRGATPTRFTSDKDRVSPASTPANEPDFAFAITAFTQSVLVIFCDGNTVFTFLGIARNRDGPGSPPNLQFFKFRVQKTYSISISPSKYRETCLDPVNMA